MRANRWIAVGVLCVTAHAAEARVLQVMCKATVEVDFLMDDPPSSIAPMDDNPKMRR